MNSTKLLLLSAVVLLTGCLQLPDVEPPTDGPIEPKPPSLTLILAEPTGTTYTNGTVAVQLQLQGDTPEQVDLLVDDQPLATVQAPYRFSWNTTEVAEGTHRLTARARIGDKSFLSEAREVVVDRTPPQVMDRNPAPSAQDVWVRQPIEATFSEPLKASTVSSASVQLSAGDTAVNTTLTLSADGKTLTMSPTARPTVPNSLQLTLTPAATDLAGNALAIPDNAWSWSLPTLLPLGGSGPVTGQSGAQSPFIRLDSQGHPFVIWQEPTSSQIPSYNVYAYRWTGSLWEAVGTALNQSPITPSSHTFFLQPKLLLDSSDNPVAAWLRNDSTEPGIHVVRLSAGQWIRLGEPLIASSSETSLPQNISLQLDSSGHPYVAWAQQAQGSSNTFIHVRRWTGSEWVNLGEPLPTTYSSPWFAHPFLALDNSNRPFIAWTDRSSYDARVNGINVRRWTGSQWVAMGNALKANLQTDMTYSSPQILIAASGNPIIAWNEYDGTVHNIHVSHWTGTHWEPIGSPLNAVSGATDTGAPQLAQDKAGNIFIMWPEEDSPDLYSGHIRRWNGTFWEPLGATIGPILSASFHVDDSGTPFIALIKRHSPPQEPVVEAYRYNH